jgi:Trk-type K+ transport system membrane component
VASFLDGLFESMSGFTTTGLSVLNIATLPKCLLFFRAYAQWIGGAGIIVLSLAIFLRPGRAAFQLYASEFSEVNLLGSVVATARVVAMIHCGLTALGFLVYLAVGMTPFAALLHVMSTLSTGRVAPARSASWTWYEIQPSHREAIPMPRAISSFSFVLSAPSAVACLCNCPKPAIGPGSSVPSLRISPWR